MADRDAIAALCDHVAGSRWEDLPAPAIAATKTFVLDSLGVAVAGSAGPRAAALAGIQSTWGSGDEASVIVHAQRLPAPAAALCNSYQPHNAEFDCLHEAAVVHSMACVLPAALAHAQRSGGVTGRDFAVAIALGVDVACHIGIGAQAGFRFFRPANAGAFGATAAVGRLMGLDSTALQHAMAITLGQLSGTMQAHLEGSPLLAMQIGFNARNAIVSCDMAAHGFTGPRAVLDGPYGYFPLFETVSDSTATTADVGRIWRITEVSHKPFPSGRATHGIVDGVLRLRDQHGFGTADIDKVVAWVPPLIAQLVERPLTTNMSVNYARLCARFVTARALLSGTVGLADFAPGALNDRAGLGLAERIDIVIDANPDTNALTPITVEITLDSGSSHSVTVKDIYGCPANPLSTKAHLSKFHANWRAGAVALAERNADRLVELVDTLEGVSDIEDLANLLVP